MHLKDLLKTFVLFTALIGFAFFITDKWVMPFYVSHGEQVRVPDVMGKDFAEAKDILEKAKLIVIRKSRYDRMTAPGHVIQQIPEPMTTVKPGRSIEIIVADNNRLVNVPLLILSTLRDAEFNLESLSLKIGKIDSQASNEFPAGVILAQSIEPNQKINIGTPINVVVSIGNNLVEAKVPYLVHKSLLDAKSLIVESGLRLGIIIKQYSHDLLPGTVIAQSLDSSMTVAPLSTIDLTVSSTDKEDE
ncbi:PASTA domain-containing protein [bacterium]|nr:PASTA domain-containing protein [bacterium]